MRVVPLVLGSFLLAYQACFAQISERKDYTQDCSKATQPIPMRFTQASSPNVHIWYVEGSTAKNLAGATTVLYYYTPVTRTWSVTVTGSVVSASGGHINVAFLPSQLNTNSLTGDFDYLCKVSDGANQVLAVTKGTLTLDEDISATAGIGGLPAVTNSLNWGLYSNYVNTGSAGPYRQGSNITFRANADGSVIIDSLESTGSYAIVSASVLSLSNLTATINTNVTVLLTNSVSPSGTNTLRVDLNVLTTNSVSPSGTNTLRTDLNVLTTNSVSPSGTNLLRIDVNVLLTNTVPPSGTNTLQAQISSNDTDIADHETRMTTLEEANSASTNTFRSITIGDTNYLAGELTTNGQFTTDSGHWTLSTSYWANSRIHINAGLTGTMTPSNALAITNGATYLVSYLKGTTNGQVTVSFGGLTNAATSGGVHYWLAPCVAQTNTFRFTMTGGGSGNYIDDIRVRKITNGLAAVADDLLVGGDLTTIGNLTVGGTMIVTNSLSAPTMIFSNWVDWIGGSRVAYTDRTGDPKAQFDYDLAAPQIYRGAANIMTLFLFKTAPDTNAYGIYGKFIAQSNVNMNGKWMNGAADGTGMTNGLYVTPEGWLGVGTNVPDSIFHAELDTTAGIFAKVANRLGLARFLVAASATNDSYSQYTHTGGSGPWSAGSDGSGLFRIVPGNSLSGDGQTGLTQLASGNTGFGNTNPLYRLHLTDGEVNAPTGSFAVINGQTSNAWETARQAAISGQTVTNAPVHIFGSDGMSKSATNNFLAGYSNAVSGDLVLIAPATHTIPDTYTITLKDNVTVACREPGRKAILNRASGTGYFATGAAGVATYWADIEFRYTQLFASGGWQFSNATGEFTRCVFTPSGTPSIATITAAAGTTNTLTFRETRAIGDTSIGSGATLNGNFYSSSYGVNGSTLNTNWTTKTFYVDINSNNVEKATDTAYRNPAGTILTNGANTSIRLTQNGTNYLLSGEAASSSGTNVFAFLAQTNDMPYAATNSYQRLTNFVVVSTQNVSVTGSNITVLADGYYRLGFDLSAKQASATDQLYITTLFVDNAAEDEISAMNQLDNKEGQLNAQGIMLLSSGAVIDVRHWVNSEESLTVRRASLHVKSMAAGGESLAVDSTAGTNAQARVAVLETNTASLAQGVAATNAQFYGTNFPLTLAASDIVAFTNRANATNVYLLGLISRPCDLKTYNGGAGSITATCDLVYFLPTNDLVTATPVTSFTNITISQAGASGSLNVVGVTNRLYALMLTNAVGSGSWHINIDGIQH